MLQCDVPGYWQCLNGHLVASESAKVCPECRSDIMWRDGEPPVGAPAASGGSPTAGGSPFAAPAAARVGISPWLWVLLGLAIGGVGAAIWAHSDTGGGAVFGLFIIGVGATVNLVGVVAAGVRMGIDASDATR